jgi:hypothetical protein
MSIERKMSMVGVQNVSLDVLKSVQLPWKLLTVQMIKIVKKIAEFRIFAIFHQIIN